jgi:hypothetical protein
MIIFNFIKAFFRWLNWIFDNPNNSNDYTIRFVIGLYTCVILGVHFSIRFITHYTWEWPTKWYIVLIIQLMLFVKFCVIDYINLVVDNKINEN